MQQEGQPAGEPVLLTLVDLPLKEAEAVGEFLNRTLREQCEIVLTHAVLRANQEERGELNETDLELSVQHVPLLKPK